MQAKTFEIRDRKTFIPVLAVRLNPVGAKEQYLLARAGYGLTALRQGTRVVMSRISADGGKLHYSPVHWAGRTLPTAHQFIIDHFDELESGAVIDVEFILGETETPKKSEHCELLAD